MSNIIKIYYHMIKKLQAFKQAPETGLKGEKAEPLDISLC